MVESKNSPDNYETLKITIEAIMKNPEILKFVPDHLNTKKMSKNRIKSLFLINIRLMKCVIKLFPKNLLY